MFNTLGNSIPRNGLVWEWLLDGNALDTSWSWNNWTATNVTYVKTDKGYQSQAGSFNGSSSYVNIWASTLSTLINSRTWFSINFVVSFTNFTWTPIIIDWRDTDYNWAWIECSTWWILKFIRSDWSVADIACQSSVISPWIKYNINLTYDWTNANFTINWTPQTSWTSTRTLNNATNVNIWSWLAWWTRFAYLNWILQTFRIYNRILSQYEIQLLYLEWLRQLWPTATPKYPSLLSGLVGYWDFRGTAHNLVDGSLATITWATLTTDRFWNSNSAYSYTSNNCSIDTITLPTISTWAYSLHWAFYPTVTATSWDYNIVWRWSTWVANEEPIYFYYWWYGTNQYRILVQNTSNSYFWWTFNKTFSANTWYNITITVWWWNIKVYFDWVLDQTIAYTWTAYTRTTWFAIWNRWYNRNEWWEWKIQDTFLFNKELSSDEVNILNNLTSQDYIYPTPSYDLASLQDWILINLNWINNWTTTLYDISWNWKNWTVSSTPTYNRQWKKKTVSLSSQSISWTSTSFTMATCFEKVSWKWTLQVNPAYITTTWITSWTREITDIRVYNRSLSSIEQEQLKYAVIGNFIY